jgi:hypothetical protein
MTGKAVEYFSALARCVPPHPVTELLCPILLFAFLTLKYSIKHCRSRIKYGMLMMNGTQNAPPQFRFGGPVELMPEEKNMHKLTNRSPSTFA